MQKVLLFCCGLLCFLGTHPAFAQFNLDGQLIQRSEFRNGYGRLITRNEDPAAFIAHRARLQASYQREAFTFYASVQDVRTWGNTSQTKLTDNFLSLHEAWLESNLGEHWKLKLGRQELNYDNARFLGNLDWALQGRAHDFGLLKYEKNSLKLHVGGGYNQDAQQLSGTTFTTANQYKVAQLARLENTYNGLQYAVLFWNDGRQYVQTDNTGAVEDKSVHYRQTLGLPTLKYQLANTTISGFYYHQVGKDPIDRKVSAYDVSAQLTQQVNLDSAATRKLRLVAGFEIISGTSNASASERSRSFSPLYGTNHAHNGYMDLFYVGGAHENFVGLQDYFLRARFDFSPRFFIQTDGHLFLSQADAFGATGERLDKYLGTELDFSGGFVFNEAISLQGGYSQLFHSGTFEAIHNRGALKPNQNWAYLMVVFRPTMKNKIIGILL